MMNKKADLRDHVVEIILAAIILIGIFLVAYRAYELRTEDVKNAQKFADIIEEEINALSIGTKNLTFQGFHNEWYLTAWSKVDPERPDKCFFSSCVCIYPDSKNNKFLPNNLKQEASANCEDKGIVREFEIENLEVSSLTIPIGGGDFGSHCEILDSPIPLEKTLLKIQFEKTPNSIKATHFTKDYNANKELCEIQNE